MTLQKISVLEKFNLFNEYWNPKIIGKLNGQDVKIVKVKGEMVWHDHKEEDELFYILKGVLNIEFTNQTITLHPNDLLIIPRGTLHKPVAKEEVWLLLFEPSTIKHTGDVQSDMTLDTFDEI